MTNLNFRLANKGDLKKLIQISTDPINNYEGSLAKYLLGDRTRHPDIIPAAWEDAILNFIYSDDGWYTCVVAEVEETREVVGYSVWEWYDYDKKFNRIDEAYRPAKVQAIWDALGADEPRHRPPRSYDPEAYEDGVLQTRWHAAGPGSKYETAHEGLLVTAGSITFSQFWQICHVAIDPRPEHKDVKEKLVRWGLETAAEEALPVIVACNKGEMGFYTSLGFRYRATLGVGIPNEKWFIQAWLQKDPESPEPQPGELVTTSQAEKS